MKKIRILGISGSLRKNSSASSVLQQVASLFTGSIDFIIYEFVEKPVALITASSVGDKGHAALLLVLSAITADISHEHALLIPFIRAKLNADGAIKDPETLSLVKKLVDGFTEKLTRK